MSNSFDYVRDHQKEICEWLRENDIDPGLVPMHSLVTLADDQITYQVIVKDDRGKSFLDPTTGQLTQRTETKPMLVEPNETVRAWLVPRCPTCGR